MSATVRSLVYLAGDGPHWPSRHTARRSCEVGYVTLTAGVYAGLQQNALRIRSRLLGNLILVLGVPGLAQVLDWLTHHLTHTVATSRTILARQLLRCAFCALTFARHAQWRVPHRPRPFVARRLSSRASARCPCWSNCGLPVSSTGHIRPFGAIYSRRDHLLVRSELTAASKPLRRLSVGPGACVMRD
jgi:hypothetical protein